MKISGILRNPNFGGHWWRKSPVCVAKTKALISFAVTAKLICAFVFAYADCWFSHAAPQKPNYELILNLEEIRKRGNLFHIGLKIII